MPGRNPVHWFEIPVTDMSRAATFYEHVFELKLERIDLPDRRMARFEMNVDVLGAAGALVQQEGLKPSPSGILIYFMASDIDAVLARVREQGGKVVTPKISIGEYGAMALFLDTEGNRIGLHSMR